MAHPSPHFEHRNLPLLMLQARETVMARFRPLLNAKGVTEQQWRVIRALLDKGALEPRQIGQLCHISSPSLAGILARMDDLGLIARIRIEHDQRRVEVTVTEKGLALAAELNPKIEAEYAALEARMGQAFVQQLYASLDEVVARLAETNPNSDAQ